MRALGYEPSVVNKQDKESNQAKPNRMVEFSTLPKIDVPRNSRGMDEVSDASHITLTGSHWQCFTEVQVSCALLIPSGLPSPT